MKKKSDAPPTIDASALLSELEQVEPAWADFARGLIGDRLRIVRYPTPSPLRARSLAEVQRILALYERELAEGDRYAILKALVLCAEENVPQPYWLGAAVIDICARLNAGPVDLHKLFGADGKFPAKGKKARTNRDKPILRAKLWAAVMELKRNTPGMSDDAAIERARADLNFPYAQRASTDLFNEYDAIHKRYFDAVKGITRNKVR